MTINPDLIRALIVRYLEAKACMVVSSELLRAVVEDLNGILTAAEMAERERRDEQNAGIAPTSLLAEVPIHNVVLSDFDGSKLFLKSAGGRSCGVDLAIQDKQITLPVGMVADAMRMLERMP